MNIRLPPERSAASGSSTCWLADPDRVPINRDAAVSAELAGQVLGALHELVRGLYAADRERMARLAQTRPAHMYEGLLTVLPRLIFLLVHGGRPDTGGCTLPSNDTVVRT